MSASLITCPRAENINLCCPGLTVWRPVFRGQLVDPILQQDRKGDSHMLRCRLFSEQCRIHEPSITHYTVGDPHGIALFISDEYLATDSDNTICMPPDWYAIELTQVGNSGRWMRGVPLLANDIASYIDFRNEISRVFGDEMKATEIRFEENPDLHRMFCVMDADKTNYLYRYFK